MYRPIIVLVCGGRKFSDRERVFKALDELGSIVQVVHGDATGADSLARDWAIERRVPHTPFPAKWKEYGNKAGPIRNSQMLRLAKPDMVLAFDGGKGTANMVKQARRQGLPIVFA